MARRARLVLPGVPLHVVQRGNNRGACFFCDADRLRYLALLAEQAATFDCAVHAYVLMTNHVHLLLTPNHVNSASLLMRHLGQEYVQYVNRVHERTGSLWEGRFHSSLVDSESYLLTCHRYIELNPVRAGLVGQPGDYPWSSFNVYGHGRPDSLIEPHAQFRALGADEVQRRENYRALFGLPLEEEFLGMVRAAVNGGHVLGATTFKADVERLLGRPASPRPRGRPRKSKEIISDQ